MADIDIVQKKGSSIWLWVVLVVLALAVLFWFMSGDPAPVTQLRDWGGAPVDVARSNIPAAPLSA
jgi:bacteriorhodopsin